MQHHSPQGHHPYLAFRVHVHNHTDYRRPYSTYRETYDAARALFFFSITWEAF
jgi:hypothetical protein